uniref:Uncharacterized protein n=1 Tax=Scleropages formosus TaxID=113540 RepID=A0A8C9V7B2_SCLFO
STMVKLLSAALLLLCLGHIAYAWCPWAKTRLLTINKNSVKQLKEMVNISTRWQKFTRGPTYRGDEHVIPVIYEALKHVKMISQNATTWSRQHLALFKNFLSQQVEELEKCVSSIFCASGCISASVKSHFLLVTLSGKFCGWEVVRKEVIVNLEFLNKFLDNRKKRR